MDKFVRIYGGLGNQIFQYLYGQYLVEVTGSNVYYYYGVTKSNRAQKRNFELPLLFPDIEVRKHWVISLITKYRSVEYVFRKTGLLRNFFGVVFEHNGNGYNSHVIGKGKFFIGYWQNIDRLTAQLDTIRNGVWRSRMNSLLYDENCVNNYEDSVALHVRRGDYLKLSNIYHQVTREYYIRALAFLSKNHVIGRVLVFSDDLDWCRENLDLGSFNVEYIDQGSIIGDFVAISNCRHKVIANSTFSLLAALLSSNMGLIIAPKFWAKSSHDILLPNEIIRIEN